MKIFNLRFGYVNPPTVSAISGPVYNTFSGIFRTKHTALGTMIPFQAHIPG
jgi:hypothetical protein